VELTAAAIQKESRDRNQQCVMYSPVYTTHWAEYSSMPLASSGPATAFLHSSFFPMAVGWDHQR